MKEKKGFICNVCQTKYVKWVGHCHSCSNWDTVEILIPSKRLNTKELSLVYLNSDNDDYTNHYFSSGFEELDRVLGKGFVTGSAILLGGPPGIGKSTLILQVLNNIAHKSLYITGEESVSQIKIRAKRLNILDTTKIQIAVSNNLESIINAITQLNHIKFVVIDSIQTIHADSLETSAGSISQIKFCIAELVRTIKERDVTIVLIGQITKDGQIAGPKVLEHLVDTVIYFESELTAQYHILRVIKNRFGAVNEIALFDMGSKGLREIVNPSELFLGTYMFGVSGISIFVSMEGTRPILVEVQALIMKTNMSMPKRSVIGWDVNRLSMVLAVLTARCDFFFGDKEVYLNITGGCKISDPATDLAVAFALMSAVLQKPIPFKAICLGELTLSGLLQGVSFQNIRIREAKKLGFKDVIMPKTSVEAKGMDVHHINHVKDILSIFNI
ncbi:MAG: DNA repair protein RadA [Candidatus Xenolissoclinum pacificiensis L6]|uniref:DNA repair protein RadA n=1 Tax=Candidatus Xenolissoclinum pacificiensis L6 TaxID=1401685 RepID=W2V2N1_9RICK|nr:MAG: DNA repair protein RadA [Candidatus Xenolissoclinum pacificiensis L6]